ncbi:AraC family transcriptional regulator [Halieaceae bacterium IMCC14734]|uniref:AraC family transcriptional regulator n=1 Tax=Candidatus Litorirhabdus singularis TaxID=2518993 RepID=A0ABT3TB76_9GAMM|nr:helix-turn-helix domain-containing protein [Candidatus Litorirhabdus singularis]MCX2979551.1 AraC family transcriptional regulator [Candidatus Litorirhabdus singularis]
MDTLLIFALAFGLSQVCLSMILVGLRGERGVGETLFVLLMLAVTCFLLTPLLPLPWSGFSSALSTGVPGLFWLFSAYVFDDHFRLRGWQVGLVVITVLLPVLGQLAEVSDGWLYLFFTLPQLLEFVLLGLTLWVVAEFWQVDLVESRRRLRWWFVAINGSYLFAMILMREWLFDGEQWFALAQYLPLGPVLLGMNVLLLQYKPAGLFRSGARVPMLMPSDQTSTPVPADAAVMAHESAPDPELMSRLQRLMDEAQVYREMSLTTGQLAERLAVPQYRLRQAINAGLGYRNFNDFLNSFRVAEAAQRLGDPAAESLPVLTIAMDAGFRSLSSFNKAFKDTRGMTPTAYRKSLKK